MRKVLVVDDVATDRELLGRVVSSAGHEPIFSTNGQEAFEMAKAMKPALILMDLVMPLHDGFAATRALKRDPETMKIPVVVVTTKATDPDRVWARRQGASEHVKKPYDPQKLAQLIQRYVGS